MALFLPVVFSFNCNPLRMPHIEKQFGIDFHVVEINILWETTLVCDSESAARSQLVVCSHDVAWTLLNINASSVLLINMWNPLESIPLISFPLWHIHFPLFHMICFSKPKCLLEYIVLSVKWYPFFYPVDWSVVNIFLCLRSVYLDLLYSFLTYNLGNFVLFLRNSRFPYDCCPLSYGNLIILSNWVYYYHPCSAPFVRANLSNIVLSFSLGLLNDHVREEVESIVQEGRPCLLYSLYTVLYST